MGIGQSAARDRDRPSRTARVPAYFPSINDPSVLVDLADFLAHGKAQESSIGEVMSQNYEESRQLMNTYVPSGNYAGMLLLHIASLYSIKSEETEAVIVSTTQDINAQIPPDEQHLGGAALHLCASSHNASMATHILMLRTDAIVDLRDSFGLTPLHRAVLSSCGSVARVILRRYPEFIEQKVTPNYDTAGSLAGMNCLHLAVVAALNNAPNLRDPLYHLVDHLVKQGCDVNAHDANGGGTPIHFAAARGVNDLLYLMLNSRDVKDSIDDAAGLNALHVAAISDQLIAINMLLMRGFDPNARGGRGETPLMVAAMANSVNALKLLLQKGADPKLRDENGAIALHYAAATAASDATFELLNGYDDYDINMTDNNGGTALHTVALRYSELPKDAAQKTCQILIDFAIDANISDAFGNRAFKYLPEEDTEAHYVFGKSHLYSYDNFHEREVEHEGEGRLPLGLPRLPVSKSWLEEMVSRYGPAAQDEYRREFEHRIYYFPGEPRRTPPLDREPEWWESERTYPYTQANKIVADRADIGERRPAVIIPLGPDPLSDKIDEAGPVLDENGEYPFKAWMRTDDRSHELPTRIRPDRRFMEEYNEMLLKRNQVDEVLDEQNYAEQLALDEKEARKWWMRGEPRYGIDRLPVDYRPFYFPGQAKDEVILQPDIKFPAEIEYEGKYDAEGPITDRNIDWRRPPPQNPRVAAVRRAPTPTRGIRSPETLDWTVGGPIIRPDSRASAATSSVADSQLGHASQEDPDVIKTPEPTEVTVEQQLAADQAQREFLRRIDETRPVRHRIPPSQDRAEYFRARELARGNFTNDEGFTFRDRNIVEGRQKPAPGQLVVRAPTPAGFHRRAGTTKKYGLPTTERGVIPTTK